MSMTGTEIRLHLWKDNPLPIQLQQYEDEGRTLTFVIDSDDDYQWPIDLTGRTVQFAARKPDGTVILNPCTIVGLPDNGTVNYVVTAQTVAVAGRMVAQLQIREGGKVLLTRTLDIDILPSVKWQDAVDSTDEIGVLQDTLGEAMAQLALIESQSFLPVAGGTMQGPVNMGGNKITTVGQAIEGSDAVNLSQVESITTNAVTSRLGPLRVEWIPDTQLTISTAGVAILQHNKGFTSATTYTHDLTVSAYPNAVIVRTAYDDSNRCRLVVTDPAGTPLAQGTKVTVRGTLIGY
jgi:hypothetical protein